MYFSLLLAAPTGNKEKYARIGVPQAWQIMVLGNDIQTQPFAGGKNC